MPKKRTKKIIGVESDDNNTITEVITILEQNNPQLSEILRNAYNHILDSTTALQRQNVEQVQNLQNEIKSEKDAVEKYKTESLLLLEKLKTQSIQLSDISEHLLLKDKEINQLQSLIAKKNTQILESKNELESVTKQLSILKRDSGVLKMENEKFPDQLKNLKDQYENKIKELNDQLEKVNLAYQLVLKKAKSKCNLL
jgi:chromosome segregation ATPase